MLATTLSVSSHRDQNVTMQADLKNLVSQSRFWDNRITGVIVQFVSSISEGYDLTMFSLDICDLVELTTLHHLCCSTPWKYVACVGHASLKVPDSCHAMLEKIFKVAIQKKQNGTMCFAAQCYLGSQAGTVKMVPGEEIVLLGADNLLECKIALNENPRLCVMNNAANGNLNVLSAIFDGAMRGMHFLSLYEGCIDYRAYDTHKFPQWSELLERKIESLCSGSTYVLSAKGEASVCLRDSFYVTVMKHQGTKIQEWKKDKASYYCCTYVLATTIGASVIVEAMGAPTEVKDHFTSVYVKFLFGDMKGIQLEKNLNSLVGQQSLKKQITSFVSSISIRTRLQKQSNQNIALLSPKAPHLVISGPTGCGKTTIAEILGKALKPYLKYTGYHYVPNAQMFIGNSSTTSTTVITDYLKDRANSVIVIDEAYNLNPLGNSDTLTGQKLEAVNCLMNFMDKPDYLFIFLGYDTNMKQFVSSNAGIAGRIARTFNVEQFLEDELLLMLFKEFEKRGIKVGTICTFQEFLPVVKAALHQAADREWERLQKQNARAMSRIAETTLEERACELTIVDDDISLLCVSTVNIVQACIKLAIN